MKLRSEQVCVYSDGKESDMSFFLNVKQNKNKNNYFIFAQNKLWIVSKVYFKFSTYIQCSLLLRVWTFKRYTCSWGLPPPCLRAPWGLPPHCLRPPGVLFHLPVRAPGVFIYLPLSAPGIFLHLPVRAPGVFLHLPIRAPGVFLHLPWGLPPPPPGVFLHLHHYSRKVAYYDLICYESMWIEHKWTPLKMFDNSNINI